MQIMDKFDRGDIIEFLKILAISLFLCLVFGGLDYLLPRNQPIIETVASISACIRNDDKSFTYVKKATINDEVYICGKTNEASTSFELILSEEKSEVLYTDKITSSADKKFQYRIEYDFLPGKYTIKIKDIKKIIADTKFEIVEN